MRLYRNDLALRYRRTRVREIFGYALASCFAAYSRAHSLRGLIETSTSAADARNAPTVACSRGVWANGSQLKNRQEFCQVILLMSLSSAPAAFSSASTCSGASGQKQSECG